MKYFDDFEVGQVQHSPKSHRVTEEEIVEFGTRWDSQPFHVDAEAARNTPFGGLVASSTHLFAIAIGVWNNPQVDAAERTAAVSALGFDNMRLRLPARPGDVLTSTTRVKEKRESASRPDAGILVFLNQVRNQDDEVVFEFDSAALYLKRAGANHGSGESA